MIEAGLLLVFGLTLLVGGGEAMVRGAAALARQLGVPPLVIGLTVVSFGTSAPELAVNASAALRGDGAVAFGNIVGSNLANVGLILAVCALVRPLAVQSIVITREIPMMLLGCAAAAVMGFDALRGAESSVYDRSEGLVLLLLFAVFLYYTIGETFRRRADDPFVQQAEQYPAGERLRSIAISAGLVALGLLGLAIGGAVTVSAAVEIATVAGISKAVIGLTIVALGTSLPELTASIVAVRRGEADLAVGNVVGSNIFNLLFVLGVTASIAPVPVPGQGHADLVAMLVFGASLLLFAFGRNDVTRVEGSCLLVGYLGYLVWRMA